MSYTITLPNGTTLGTIADGTVDNTTTSLTLIGRNYSNYGQIMVTDLLALLVNFSYNVSPANPQAGQLWWDSGNSLMKAYTGTVWKNIGSCTSQSTPPTTTVAGDLWWDSVNQQLYVYNGTNPYNATGWILVGPQRNGSGAVWEQIYDTGLTAHDVLSIKLDGTRTAIISSATFTPANAISGFTTITAGWNMNSADPIWGTANNASYLGNQPAANYFTNYLNNVGSGSLTLQTNVGVILGSLSNFVANVHNTTGSAQLHNLIQGANVSLHVNTSTGLTKVAAANGADGLLYVLSDPTQPLGVATKQYVDNKFNNTTLTGAPTAPNPSAGDSSTRLATTAFVTTGLSGLYSYKVYTGNTWVWTDTASANIVVAGATVATASASGFNLQNGATAVTQTDTYNGSGNSAVATTQFVKNAAQWWGGSAKFVSNAVPNAGVNDIGSNNGDFWFQISN